MRSAIKTCLELLDAGIDVLSTMNIQHLESITPTVQNVPGVTVRETVPDWVLQRVNEVVMSDLTPEALQNRMRRGDIYPLDRVGRALGNFFRPGNLIALRELALRQVAQGGRPQPGIPIVKRTRLRRRLRCGNGLQFASVPIRRRNI